MKKHFFFALFFCCVQSHFLFSQHDFRPGFIIQNNGDSVAGYVDFRGAKKSEKVCTFKASKKGETKKFAPHEIKAFGFPGEKRLEAFPLTDTQKVFVEKIISGSKSLFRYDRTFFLATDKETIMLAKKEQTKVTSQKGTYTKTSYPYISTLNVQFADCGLNANKVRYEERDITEIVQKYNTCKGSPGIVYKQNKPWTQLHFNFFSGIDISTLKVDSELGGNFEKSISSIYGITMDASAPRVNEKLFLFVEASYLKKFYQGYIQDQLNTNLTEHRDYLIDISFIKAALGIRYNFLQDASTPYLRFGISDYFTIDSDLELLTEHENEQDKEVITGVTEVGKSRPQMGIWLGAGFNKTITGKMKGFLEIRYERANGFYGATVPPNPSTRTQNINIIAGLRF